MIAQKLEIIRSPLLLLHHQDPEHMPWSICPRCTAAYEAYCATLIPPCDLDVPTSTPRHLHVHTTREILAAKGGTVGENVGR